MTLRSMVGDVEAATIVSQFYNNYIADKSFDEHMFDIMSNFLSTDKISTA